MEKSVMWDKYGWAMTMTAWTIIGSVIIFLTVPAGKTGALFLVAYGAFSASGFMGFLLGIRGVRPDDKPTHLQQIADWLTKLLLGAGLVELTNISKATWQFSKAFGDVVDPQFGPYMVLSVLIAFISLGLISGYLWSQLHYGNE